MVHSVSSIRRMCATEGRRQCKTATTTSGQSSDDDHGYHDNDGWWRRRRWVVTTTTTTTTTMELTLSAAAGPVDCKSMQEHILYAACSVDIMRLAFSLWDCALFVSIPKAICHTCHAFVSVDAAVSVIGGMLHCQSKGVLSSYWNSCSERLLESQTNYQDYSPVCTV